MNDLDFILTKNRLEILILKGREEFKQRKPTPSMVEALETLENALKLIYEMRHVIDEMNRKNAELSLQNVKAYRKNMKIQSKIKKVYNG